jgi:hypothetical protein
MSIGVLGQMVMEGLSGPEANHAPFKVHRPGAS